MSQVLIKLYNYIFYNNNKIKNDKETKQKNNIIETINNIQILDDIQKNNIKKLSYNSLLEIIWSFNANQKNLIEILEYEHDEQKKENDIILEYLSGT